MCIRDSVKISKLRSKISSKSVQVHILRTDKFENLQPINENSPSRETQRMLAATSCCGVGVNKVWYVEVSMRPSTHWIQKERLHNDKDWSIAADLPYKPALVNNYVCLNTVEVFDSQVNKFLVDVDIFKDYWIESGNDKTVRDREDHPIVPSLSCYKNCRVNLMRRNSIRLSFWESIPLTSSLALQTLSSAASNVR